MQADGACGKEGRFRELARSHMFRLLNGVPLPVKGTDTLGSVLIMLPSLDVVRFVHN